MDNHSLQELAVLLKEYWPYAAGGMAVLWGGMHLSRQLRNNSLETIAHTLEGARGDNLGAVLKAAYRMRENSSCPPIYRR
jgi:hypothetical protein